MQTQVATIATSTWGDFFKRNAWQLFGSLAFVVALGFFFHMTKAKLVTEPVHAIYWFGGAILACETVLEFVGWDGWRGATASLALRALTFVVAGWTLGLG